jgi:hypothetical protein
VIHHLTGKTISALTKEDMYGDKKHGEKRGDGGNVKAGSLKEFSMAEKEDEAPHNDVPVRALASVMGQELGDAYKQTKTTLWITQYPIHFYSTTNILPENVDQRFTQESRTKMTNTTDKQRHWSTPVLLSYNDITYK